MPDGGARLRRMYGRGHYRETKVVRNAFVRGHSGRTAFMVSAFDNYERAEALAESVNCLQTRRALARRAYTADEKARMLAEAGKLRSNNMYPALVMDLNCGLRDKELRELRWWQIDLNHKKQLTVGKSKSDAGAGRVIPLNDTVLVALETHAAWYIRRFGECKPEWYVFPAGKGQPNDPTRPVTTLRTAWTKVREKAKVISRWHDNPLRRD
jgi:integrase